MRARTRTLLASYEPGTAKARDAGAQLRAAKARARVAQRTTKLVSSVLSPRKMKRSFKVALNSVGDFKLQHRTRASALSTQIPCIRVSVSTQDRATRRRVVCCRVPALRGVLTEWLRQSGQASPRCGGGFRGWSSMGRLLARPARRVGGVGRLVSRASRPGARLGRGFWVITSDFGLEYRHRSGYVVVGPG